MFYLQKEMNMLMLEQLKMGELTLKWETGEREREINTHTHTHLRAQLMGFRMPRTLTLICGCDIYILAN